MKNTELINRLNELTVYLTKLIIFEVNHDEQLVTEGKEHIKTLMLVHNELTEDEAVSE